MNFQITVSSDKTSITPNKIISYFLKQENPQITLPVHNPEEPRIIEPNNIKILQKISENNAHTTVYQVIDKCTNELYYMKQFKDKEIFQREYQAMFKIHSKLGASSELMISQLIDIHVDTLTLFYENGECNLQQYNHFMKQLNYSWFDRVSEFNQITKVIYQIQQKFHENGFYHGDIKPQNIILCKNKDFDTLQPKLIDIQYSTFEFKKVYGFTKQYNTEKQQYSTKQSRIQSELFQLGRTLQDIMYQFALHQLRLDLKHVVYENKHMDFNYPNFQNKDSKSVLRSVEIIQKFFKEDQVQILKILLGLEKNPTTDLDLRIQDLQVEDIKDTENISQKIIKQDIIQQLQFEFKEHQDKPDLPYIKQQIEDSYILCQLDIGIQVFQQFESQLDIKNNPKYAIIFLKLLRQAGQNQKYIEYVQKIEENYAQNYEKLHPQFYHEFLLLKLVTLEDEKSLKDIANTVIAYHKDIDQFQLSRAYYQVSKFYLEKNFLDQGIENIKKALEIYQLDKNKFIVQDDKTLQQQLAYSLTIFSQCLKQQGSLEECQQYQQQAFDIYEKLNLKRNLKFGYLVLCMAEVSSEQNNYEQSIHYFEHAHKVFSYSHNDKSFYNIYGQYTFSQKLNSQQIAQQIQILQTTLEIVVKLDYQNALKFQIIQALKLLYDQQKNGLIENINSNWLLFSEKQENLEHFANAKFNLELAQLFLPELPPQQEAQDQNKNDQENIEEKIKQQNSLNESIEKDDMQLLQEYIINKIKTLDLKLGIKQAYHQNDLNQFQDLYDSIMDIVEDKPEYQKDDLWTKQILAQLYMKNQINISDVIVIIEETLPKIQQQDFPQEYTQFLYTLAVLNEKNEFYERSYQFLQLCQKFIQKFEFSKYQVLLDLNKEKMEYNAKVAREVRILNEKKEQYKHLKEKKGEKRSADITRLGLNIASIYLKNKNLEQSQHYIKEVQEFSKNIDSQFYPQDKDIGNQIYSSSNLQSPRSRSQSPNTINSIKGMKKYNKKHTLTFTNSLEKHKEQQQLDLERKLKELKEKLEAKNPTQQNNDNKGQNNKDIIDNKDTIDNKEDSIFAESKINISEFNKDMYRMKEKQKKQTDFMLNRIKEQKIIEQLNKRKRPPFKFLQKPLQTTTQQNKSPRKINSQRSNLHQTQSPRSPILIQKQQSSKIQN